MEVRVARGLTAFCLGVTVLGCGAGAPTEVVVTDLPPCAATGLLARPIQVEVCSGDDFARQFFLGGEARPVMRLFGEGERTMRFGLCPPRAADTVRYRCDAVEWYGEAPVVLGQGPTSVRVPPPPVGDCL